MQQAHEFEPPPSTGQRDAQTIALIGFAHGVSHFFHLILPPLFPWLMREFGLSFTAIGSAMTLFFVVSGFGQAAAGFLVDRFGAFRVLLVGMSCFALATLLLCFADGYPALLAVAALSGAGNSVFHPADFTVLNRHVSQARLGHAFSIHGLSGNLGWALAPVFLTSIAASAGWRSAAFGACLVSLLALALLIWFRAALADPPQHGSQKNPAAPAHPVSALAFLSSPPVWLCFFFFFLITLAFGAIQNFASPILQALYGLDLATAAISLSTYLFGGAAGILLGGFLARHHAHERLIALALMLAAGLAILLAAQVLPAWSILPVMATIGFCTGTAGPSRDLLVRRAATARFGQAAFGRVYGFVYSGLDAGLAIAPLAFGLLMDRQQFGEVLIGIAIVQSLAVIAALRVGKAV